MILDGFISSGERKPPHFHSHPIRLLKPTPCIIHLHGHSFLLTWKSLDMRAGLLHRRLFERHHEMWQDIIQSCNMPRLSGVCSAVFLWIPQRERGREKKRKTGFSCGAQQQQRRHWMSWPMKGQLLDGFPRCVLGETAYWWHLQTTNKAVRLKTPISAQWTVKMWDSIIFSNKARSHITHEYFKVLKKSTAAMKQTSLH